jgi:gamma-butyrobetaine dioxygenase
VRQVRALEQERQLEVEWEDSRQSMYPYTWLRDNCQCPLCTLQSAQARSLLLSQLDIHTGVDRVQVTDNNKVTDLGSTYLSPILNVTIRRKM